MMTTLYWGFGRGHLYVDITKPNPEICEHGSCHSPKAYAPSLPTPKEKKRIQELLRTTFGFQGREGIQAIATRKPSGSMDPSYNGHIPDIYFGPLGKG